MTEPGGHTGEQPVVTPTVSTEPVRGPWHFSRIPSHLGRARTSTLVLGVLFLTIGALYLNIRPAPPVTAATTTPGTGTEQPAPVPATTSAPETTPAPTTTAPETTSVPTTSAEPTTPTTTGRSVETTETSPATSVPATSPAPTTSTLPTTVSPPG